VGSGALDLRAYLTPRAAAAALEVAYRPREWLTTYAEGRILAPFRGPVTGYAGVGVRARW